MSIFVLVLLRHSTRLLVSVFLAGCCVLVFEQKSWSARHFIWKQISVRVSVTMSRYQVDNHICAHEKSKQKLFIFIC